jgi:hypothetical protein
MKPSTITKSRTSTTGNHRIERAARAANKAPPSRPDAAAAAGEGKHIEADVKLNRDLSVWKKLHLLEKDTKAKIDVVKKPVLEALIRAGADRLLSKLGHVVLETKETSNWQAYARELAEKLKLSDAEVEAGIAKHTKESEPYVKATWSVTK